MEAVDIDVFKLVASERRCSVPTQRWLKGFEVLRRVVFSKEALEASSQKVVTAHEQFFLGGWQFVPPYWQAVHMAPVEAFDEF